MAAVPTGSVDKRMETDILVVGSGGAALRAAIEASKGNARVTVLSKGPFGKGGATIMAGGGHGSFCSRQAGEVGLPGQWDPGDSLEELMADVCRIGGYLNNQKMVEALCRHGARRIKDLVDWGAQGIPLRAPYARYPRVYWLQHGATTKALLGEARKLPLEIIEHFLAVDLLTRDGKVTGVAGLNLENGEFTVIKSKAVILGTGGFTAAFEQCTACDDVTGDGQAMAYRAGAGLVDMEMIHFLSLALRWPPYAVRSRFTELWRMGRGPYRLYNVKGERFLEKWTADLEATLRTELLSTAIHGELVAGRGSRHNGVYWSVKHLPTNLIRDIAHFASKGHELVRKFELPMIKEWGYMVDIAPLMKRVLEQGEALEVAPAAHTSLGGIMVDENMEAGLSGLFAVGECTGGTLGAAREYGAALTMIQVHGVIAGQAAVRYADENNGGDPDACQVEAAADRIFHPLAKKDGPKVWDLLRKLRQIAYYEVGPYRDGKRLAGAVGEIEKMRKELLPDLCVQAKDRVYNRELIRALELQNMLTCVEAAARAALLRTESRGFHYRCDYPSVDFDHWTGNIVVRQGEGRMELSLRPIVKTMIEPPAGAVPWTQYRCGVEPA